MNKMARRLSEVPAGSWAKWVIAGLWLAVLVIAFPLSGKLTGAERNNASAWLPANAESTKVVEVQSRFQSPGIFSAVVVYDRASGLTAQDRAKVAADARRFASLGGVSSGQVAGPIPSADGTAVETTVQVDLGNQGLMPRSGRSAGRS